MVSEAMLLVERSFGTGEKEERSSSSCGSEKVSHEGDEGKADGKMQEKRKERPELKVVICKDGRSSARVSLYNSSFFSFLHYIIRSSNIQLRRLPPLSPRPRPSSVKIINEPLPLPWEATSRC